jgi:hypothetical protein
VMTLWLGKPRVARLSFEHHGANFGRLYDLRGTHDASRRQQPGAAPLAALAAPDQGGRTGDPLARRAERTFDLVAVVARGLAP